jgi:hypothetical protein
VTTESRNSEAVVATHGKANAFPWMRNATTDGERNVSQEPLWLWRGDVSETQEGKRPPLEAGNRGMVWYSIARRTGAFYSGLCELTIAPL